MPRTGGRRGGKGVARTMDTNTTTPGLADYYHSRDTPNCLRLNEICAGEVGLGENPKVDRSAWASLVRDYILQIVAATVPPTKSKKKKKKKKKKKAATEGQGDETLTPAPSEEATTPASTDAIGAEPAGAMPPVASVAPVGQEEARDNDASVAVPAKAVTPPTWESQRDQRRRDWVDRFLDHCRQQSRPLVSFADYDDSSPPPSVEEIGERLDQFLAWLSQTPDHVAFASPGGNLRKPPGGKSSSADVTLFRGRELHEAVQLIECVDCRQRVLTCLDSNIVLAGTQMAKYPVSTNQYIAMEEGTSKVLPLQALLLVAPETPSDFWKVERTDGTHVVWNREILEFWLREYLILGGLGYDYVVVGPTGTSLTSNEGMMRIHEDIDEAESSHVEEIKSFAESLEAQAEELTNLSPSMGSNVDFKSNQIMRDIDGALSHMMQKILDYVSHVSQTYQEIALYRNCASRRSDYPSVVLNSQCLSEDTAICNLWDAYLNGVDRVFVLTAKFEEKLFDLVDNSGNLPFFYYNSASRELFKQFLNQKLLAIHGVVEAVDKALASEIDDRVETVSDLFTPTFLRSIFAMRELVCTVVPDHPKRRTPLDSACEDILYELREWCEKVHRHTEAQLLREHEKRRLKMVVAADRADAIIRMAITDITRGNEGDPSIEPMYRQWQTRDVDAVEIEDVASLRQVYELIVHKAGAMIRLWMKLRAYGAVTPSYPSKLVGIPASLVSYTAVGSTSSHSRAECLNGTESRAGCILSSLLFDWMSRRFDELQAEKAEQELLTATDFEGDADGTSWSKVAKGGNKTKKKKEKKLVSPTKANSSSQIKEEVVEVVASHDEGTSDDKLVLATMAGIELADEVTGKQPLPKTEPPAFPKEPNASGNASSEVPQTGVGTDLKSDVAPKSKPSEYGSEASSGATFPSPDSSPELSPRAPTEEDMAHDATSPSPDPSPDVSPKAPTEGDIAHDAKDSSIPSTAPVSTNGMGGPSDADDEKAGAVSAHLSSASGNGAVLAKKDMAPASYLDLECKAEKGVFYESGSLSPAEFLLGRYLEIVKLKDEGAGVVDIQ
jgi:hypothetical protein